MMPQNSHSYLETQVLTSPPQKLQLILIEAAIRFAKKAEMLRTQGGDEAEACVAIGRAQKIVSEIISGLNQEVDPELVGQIASIYIFISQALVKANLPENSQQLADAIRILEEERITWRLVCEKLAAESADQNEAAMLHQQTREVEATETDSVVMNATAGNANVTNTGPLSMSAGDLLADTFLQSWRLFHHGRIRSEQAFGTNQAAKRDDCRNTYERFFDRCVEPTSRKIFIIESFGKKLSKNKAVS